MNLEEALNQRLEILLNSGVISQRISDYCKNSSEAADKTKTGGRRRQGCYVYYTSGYGGTENFRGKEEKPLDSQILESVKQEPAYSRALDFLTYMLNQTDLEFPDTEKRFFDGSSV